MIESHSPATGESVAKPEFHPDLYALSRGEIDLHRFIEKADENISWLSDDSPFFYQLSKTLPREVAIVLLIGVAILAGISSVFGLIVSAKETNRRGKALIYFAAFAAVGLGYFLIEIGVLQRYILLWEHQTLALSVVLAVILASSGLGSLFSRKVRSPAAIIVIVGAVALISTPMAIVAGGLMADLSGAAVGVKILATLLGVGPLFFCMGMPFPWMLNRLSLERSGRRLFPWMIGVNSVATLLGGALSMALALEFGFRLVLFAGVFAYICFAALILSGAWRAASGLSISG